MVLVFVGTLDQVHIGVYEAENRYFKSLFLFFTLPGTQLRIPWFPGGYIVGTLLLVNLIAAHIARFKLSWKKVGILLLHSGLILLLVGQLFADIFIDLESQMRLDQGQTKNYSESLYHDELAIIDTSAADADQVIAGRLSGSRNSGVLSQRRAYQPDPIALVGLSPFADWPHGGRCPNGKNV
jgi:cytochrome c biogenesis factor